MSEMIVKFHCDERGIARSWDEVGKLIRCKDCKWRNAYRFPPKYDERDYCDKHEKIVGTDGYCSWAERRCE